MSFTALSADSGAAFAPILWSLGRRLRPRRARARPSPGPAHSRAAPAPCASRLHLAQLFGRALGDHAAAAIAAFRPPGQSANRWRESRPGCARSRIRRVPGLQQLAQRAHQLGDVVKVQAGGGLVKQEQRAFARQALARLGLVLSAASARSRPASGAAPRRREAWARAGPAAHSPAPHPRWAAARGITSRILGKQLRRLRPPSAPAHRPRSAMRPPRSMRHFQDLAGGSAGRCSRGSAGSTSD